MKSLLILGTPSISDGKIKPCQWIEVDSCKWLVTCKTISSPSLNLSKGAGRELLTVVALRCVPVKLTLCSPIFKLNTLPVKVFKPLLLPTPANKILGLIANAAAPIVTPVTNCLRDNSLLFILFP